MICYRVVRRKYADLSGDGARLYGGRSNPVGVAAIYTAENIGLAVLEVLVHLDKSEVPNDYVVMAIDFPGRRAYRARAGESTRRLGSLAASTFLDSRYFRPVLRVPSVIVPREHNYVLFPDAAGFEARIVWTELLEFDRRLFSFGTR